MAKRKINRSEAIRDYAEANPNEKPKEIAEALKTKGIKISAQYISTILSNNRKRAGKKRGRKAGANGVAGIEDLMKAKQLVQSVGSVEKAQQAIASYAKLMA